MIFENYPVWNFRPHFSELQSSFEDNVSFKSSGFGRSTPWSLQPHTQRVFNLKFQVKYRELISEIERFLDERTGPLKAFYIPTFKSDFHLLEDISPSDVSIFVSKSGFATDFLNHPGNPFIALIDDEKIIPLKIIGVDDTNPNQDRIEFLNPIGNAFKKESTIVCFLHLVKLDQSFLEWEYLADDFAQTSVRFIERYKSLDGGDDSFPYFFYRIRQASMSYYWTSYSKDIIVESSQGDIEWISQNMTHSQIRKSKEFLDEGLTLTLYSNDSNFFLRQFVKGPSPIRTFVDIYQNNYADFIELDSPFYSAEIQSVHFLSEGKIEVKLTSVLRVNEWQIPRSHIQRTCNWMLFEPNTCRANEGAYLTSASISGVNEFEIESSVFSGFPNAYFALGKVQFGDETRMIRKHQGSILTLNFPFAKSPLGQNVSAAPGCDKQLGTCTAKFSNAANFGGFPFVPTKNPQLKRQSTPKQNGGGKK